MQRLARITLAAVDAGQAGSSGHDHKSSAAFPEESAKHLHISSDQRVPGKDERYSATACPTETRNEFVKGRHGPSLQPGSELSTYRARDLRHIALRMNVQRNHPFRGRLKRGGSA